MDPLADKILIASILICFVGLGLVPGLAAVIIVAREFIITSLRFLVLQNDGKVIPASILGKLKTASQMVTIFSIFAVQSCLEFFAFNGIFLKLDINLLYLFQNVLIWLSVLFSFLSGIMYVYSNRKYIVFNS